MEWQVNIEKVTNGYIVKFIGGDNPGTAVYSFGVECEEDKEELNVLKWMFYDIMENFGVFNSKHKEYRLDISVKKQRKE